MNWPSSWTVSYLFIYPAISSWKNCQINSPQASSPGWAHNCSVSTTVPIFFTYQSTSQQQSRAPGVQLTSQQSSSQGCLRHCLLYQTQSLDLKIISDVKRCVTAFVCPSQCLYIYMRRSEHTAEIASSMLSEIERRWTDLVFIFEPDQFHFPDGCMWKIFGIYQSNDNEWIFEMLHLITSVTKFCNSRACNIQGQDACVHVSMLIFELLSVCI